MQFMESPKLTVLTPVHNGERFLDRTIESILAQDFADFEFVIVDDGSTDATAEILQRWAARDPRIVIERITRHTGTAAALNRGLAIARGEYVGKQDSDDICVNGRLRAQVELLDREPDAALVSANHILIEADGRWAGDVVVDIPPDLFPYLFNFSHADPGAGTQGMFRREAALEIGGFCETLEAAIDYEFNSRLITRGRLYVLPMVGSLKRIHPDQMSNRLQRAQRRNSLANSRRMLGTFLERELSDDEFLAVTSIWRQDGLSGVATSADRVLREAYARFAAAQHDDNLRRLVRRFTAARWVLSAITLLRRGAPVEAVSYLVRAAQWDAPGTAAELGAAVRRLLRRHYRRLRPVFPDTTYHGRSDMPDALRMGLGIAKRRGSAEHIEQTVSSSIARNASSSRSPQEGSSGR
jgi:glycosyltransferase involved in cell wall biosynthesis